MRRIIIGDVHGDHKGLKALIEHIHPSSEDMIIFAGDICDHFPNPNRNVRLTVDYILELSKTHKVVVVRGNHDSWFAHFCMSGERNLHWITNSGGAETLQDYKCHPLTALRSEIPWFHCNFFVTQMIPWWCDDTCVVVHAGLTESLYHAINAIEKPYFSSEITWEIADAAMWGHGDNRNLNMSLPNNFDKKLCVIGHTASLRIDGTIYSGPFIFDKLICIDSARGLHACVIGENDNYDIVQSPVVTLDFPEAALLPFMPDIENLLNKDHELSVGRYGI